jgi:N-acetylglucosaminyldiphosphoundecaprenol N-acetyl-beta-D-mannosaminyltransferase
MEKYFNVNLEFDHSSIREVVNHAIALNEPGYVCIVDANVLTIAQKNANYRNLLNQSIVNSCDGSSIAMLASLILKERKRAWNGPEIFNYYVKTSYRQLLLGSTDQILAEIKEKLGKDGFCDSHISVMPLPFTSIENFDYKEISRLINQINPDIIWVSLGAPKQEFFMKKLEPYLLRGVMFGIGAAFNFYIGKIGMPNFRIGPLRFIWICRIWTEPRKQLMRLVPYLKIIPRLYFTEKKKRNRS